MSREGRSQVGKISIELDLDDAAQRLIWEYWQFLTRSGQASKWAREVLQGALPLRNIKKSASKQLRVSDELVYENVD